MAGSVHYGRLCALRASECSESYTKRVAAWPSWYVMTSAVA